MVEVSGELELIKSVSEPTGSIQMAIQHTMTWPDSRLAFNTTTRNNGCFDHERAVFLGDALRGPGTLEYSFLNAIGSFGTASTFLVFKNMVRSDDPRGRQRDVHLRFQEDAVRRAGVLRANGFNAPSKMVAFTAPTTGQELFKIPTGGLLGGTTSGPSLART